MISIRNWSLGTRRVRETLARMLGGISKSWHVDEGFRFDLTFVEEDPADVEPDQVRTLRIRMDREAATRLMESLRETLASPDRI